MSICINCGKEGPHYIPPCFGDEGFFHCKKKEGDIMSENEVESMPEALTKEIKRNKGLVEIYEEIGTPGIFAMTMIQKDIRTAERSVSEQDTVQMVKSLQTLRDNKE